MVSVGRGRGWSQNDKNSLPQPRKLLCSDDVNYINLFKLINSVNNENTEQLSNDIAKLINEKMKNENLKDINDKFYKYALNNRDFGMKLAMIYRCDTIRDIRDSDNRSFFHYFLTQCQIDFERRKELREESTVHFHNAICLLSTYLKDSYSRIKFAVVDYMEMLLETHSSEDILLFVEQLVEQGIRLHDMFKEKLSKVMIDAREILIKENISVTSRQMLLYAIDLESRDFKPLPNRLIKFYKSQLDKIVI